MASKTPEQDENEEDFSLDEVISSDNAKPADLRQQQVDEVRR